MNNIFLAASLALGFYVTLLRCALASGRKEVGLSPVIQALSSARKARLGMYAYKSKRPVCSPVSRLSRFPDKSEEIPEAINSHCNDDK